MILTNMGLATNPTSFTKNMMSKIQSLFVFPVKTELDRFFSEDEDVKLISVAAEYYKVFLDKAQPDSHQLLHYRQHR